MRHWCSRIALSLVFAMASAVIPVAAAEITEFGAPNQDFLDHKAELEKMISSRDVDLYELYFQPLELDEVIVKDRLGRERVYSYLAFCLRNQVIDATIPAVGKPSRYSEVLQAIAQQYEVAKVSPEGGGKLSIDKIEGPDGVILERQDMKPRTRSVNITVLAYDEHGTRIHLLDEPIGSGPQENFNFPDYGEPNSDDVFKRVREEAEEAQNRRLLTVDEIRKLKMPPYNPAKRNEEGVSEGEVFGVVLFNRLSLYGNHFTVEVRGLCNKFRLRGADGPKNQPENYLTSRLLRRVMVLHYDRPGDEFFRDLDRFTLGKGGWEWVSTFQRLKQRKSVSYAKYFLNNIVDEKNERQPPVEQELWEYYNAVRTGEYPNAGEEQLPDLEKTLRDR
jgi:hypothetical protein